MQGKTITNVEEHTMKIYHIFYRMHEYDFTHNRLVKTYRNRDKAYSEKNRLNKAMKSKNYFVQEAEIGIYE